MPILPPVPSNRLIELFQQAVAYQAEFGPYVTNTLLTVDTFVFFNLFHPSNNIFKKLTLFLDC